MHEKSLRLDLMYKAHDEWTECFETGPITLPSVGYLGFSAETGELSDNHDIITVATNNLYISESYGSTKGDGRRPNEAASGSKDRGDRQQGGSWGMFFFKMIMFILIIGAAYVGFTMYRANKRGSRF